MRRCAPRMPRSAGVIMIESIYDLEADECPEILLETVQHLWEAGEDAKCLAFSIADGLYWYCVLHHGGMWSTEYRISCELNYSPGMGEGAPDIGDDEREDAHYVYDLLAKKFDRSSNK